ncbi:MAG: hypothetical protein MUF48_23785, partial [Pirellulaceae bacterium]|nr:hypothetical protein [Pirellulaceae bacterium]
APWRDAVVYWSMSEADAQHVLEPHGDVAWGVELTGDERAASLARGGDGRVLRLQGGYVTTSAAASLELTGKQASLCLRVRDPSRQWLGGLLATPDAQDRHANLISCDGKDLVYRWRTTPLWERVQGMRAPTEQERNDAQRGSYGFNGESNDAHDLLTYEAHTWICSIVRVHDDGRVVVSDASGQAERSIDIGRQSLSDAAFFVGSKAGTSEFLEGDIAEILVYRRPLTDDESRQLHHTLLTSWHLGAADAYDAAAIPADGLVLHLDAAHAQTDEQGRVALCGDSSGQARDVQQPVAERRPQRLDDVLGGRPALRFQRGQYLQGPAVLAAGDDSFTIVALWRRDHLNGSQVICEQNAPGAQTGRRAALLAQGSVAPQYAAGNFTDGVLPVSAPIDWIGRDGWHDVIVQFADTVIELYVDGVLVDEEWPHGALHEFRSPFVIGSGYTADGQCQVPFSGEIDHLALWNRALTPREIEVLSGGADHVARRDREILGTPQASLQYWRPRGKAYAGDCMVTCKDGEFHVFYLYDRLHHAAKWGLGAHQYGHFSSTDLKHWTHHPLAVPIERQWECAMGTGNVIYNELDGKWYAFYTDCGSRIEFVDKPQPGAWLFRAVSDDGIHFQKDFRPVLPGFDSDIFYVPETRTFHLIAEGGRTHYQSGDLTNWSEVADSEFRKTAERDDVSRICPDTLAWNGWYYFTAGSSRIYKSRQPLGPWEEIPKNIFDGLFFSKMHEFRDGRALAAGWVAFPGWGGNLVVRELVQSSNGDLGLTFVPEMIPASGPARSLRMAASRGQVEGDFTALHVRAGATMAYAAVDDVPHDSRIRVTVRPAPGVEVFGVCLCGEGDYQAGSELSFRPAMNHVQFAHPHAGGLAPIVPVVTLMDGDTGALPPVDRLQEPLTLDIIMTDRILDVCLAERRTFIARRADPGGHRLFLFAQGGDVVFEQLEVRPLWGQVHLPRRGG